MNRSRLSKCTVALLICLLLGWWLFRMPPIPSHRGDGLFEDLSRRMGIFPMRGYRISMPEFDMARQFEAEYQLAGLSDIGCEAVLYLGIHDAPEDEFHLPSGNGKVRLELVDSRGRARVNVSGRLDWYTCMVTTHLLALYMLPGSRFTPEPKEEYRLHLSYSPDPNLAGYKGFAYIQCGGRK